MKSIALLVLGLFAAHQAASPRDGDVRPTQGTASVTGIVVTDAERPEPVRRAIVTLTGSELTPSRSAITNDNGRFSIGGLPEGRFTLTATKASFITSAYGATRPGRPGTPIVLVPSAQITDVVLRLWRGAAVAGILRDDAGVPVSGIPVTAIRARATSNSLLTLSNNGTSTNDRGEFRIFGLEPGTYALVARPSAGGGGPMTTMTEAEVDRLLSEIRRGPRVTGGAQQADPVQRTQEPFDYAPVFFPGTSVITQATPIALAAGEERSGLDFSLRRVATATVEGVVSRADGQPAAGATVQLTAGAAGGPFTIDSPPQLSATTGPTGIFVIPQVGPGDYQIVVRAPATPPPPAPERGQVSASPTGIQHWGEANVVVTSGEVKSVAITVEPGPTLTGRLRFDSDTLKPPADLTRLRVVLMPTGLSTRPNTPIRTIAFSAPALVQADGSFRMANLAPGSYVLQVVGLPVETNGWWPRSAVFEGRDLFDGVVTVQRGAELGNVVITFSERHTELTGLLQTAEGRPASDVFIIAFAADRQFWGPYTRRVQAVRPGLDGRFAIRDLPPGVYLIAAITDVDQDEWQDPSFLERLQQAAIRIAIGEGEKKVQDIRIQR